MQPHNRTAAAAERVRKVVEGEEYIDEVMDILERMPPGFVNKPVRHGGGVYLNEPDVGRSTSGAYWPD